MERYELKTGAKALIRERSPKLLLTAVIYLAVTIVMSELRLKLSGAQDAWDYYINSFSAGEFLDLDEFYSFIRPAGVPFALVLWLLTPIMNAGFMSFCLKNTRVKNYKCEYSDIFDGFLCFIKIILISIVTGILTFLWSLLFIVPGIAAAYRYRQVYYILLDDPSKGVMQCIRESKKLMNGHKLDLFILDLSFIGWFILDGLVILLIPTPFALPLVSVWLTPYTGLCYASFYNDLTRRLCA